MDGENRDQKLRAGKQKLAQFQRKKKKKKTRTDEVESLVVAGESASIVPSLRTLSDTDLMFDSDSLTISSCSEDDTDSTQEILSRAQLQLKSSLQAKSRRVEELEESLVGKQLALDNVIQENEKLKTLIKHVDHSQVSEPNHNALVNNTDKQNQSSYANGTSQSQSVEAGTQADNGTGSEGFSISDVQELGHHVQWLQLQLKQANSILKAQNEKQIETSCALQHAKDEIMSLQDSISQKDQLLNGLAEKITQISVEYGTLRESYAQLLTSRNENLSERLQEESDREEMTTTLTELQHVLSEKELEIKEFNEKYEIKVNQLDEEYDKKIKNMGSELEKLRVKNEELTMNLDKERNESVGLQSYCDTLTKGLEFLKAEHENAVTELNEISVGFKVLKSEYDILVEEKGQCEIETETVKAELDLVESDRGQMVAAVNDMQNIIGNLESQIKCTTEKIEGIEVLLQDNTVLADELTKLKMDNAICQNQIAEYEGKHSESEEIFDENHSLHVQNDELNNKINNQKDVIASLKNELEVLTMENTQFVELTAGFQQVKKDNSDLQIEKEQLINVVSDLKQENLQYKNSQLLLNEEIQNLQQCLAESNTELLVKVPLLTSCVQNKHESIDSNTDHSELGTIDSIVVHRDIVIAEQHVQKCEAIPQVLSEHRNITDHGSKCKCDKIHEHTCDMKANCDNDTELVYVDGASLYIAGDVAKTTKVCQEMETGKGAKIVELEEEIDRLNNVILEIHASRISREVVIKAQQLLQGDISVQTCKSNDSYYSSLNNKVPTETSGDDTAYESLNREHIQLSRLDGEKTSAEIDILTERLANMQQEFVTVIQTLHHKTKQCENLKLELEEMKTVVSLDDAQISESCSEDILADKVEILKDNKLLEVSDTSSVTCLEKDLHASPFLCFVQNDNVVPLVSFPGIVDKGDQDVYVIKDSFQNAIEDTTDLADTPAMVEETDAGETHEQVVVNVEILVKEVMKTKEEIRRQESEMLQLKEANLQMIHDKRELINCVDTLQSSAELLTQEIESKNIRAEKMRTDQDDLELFNAELQAKLKELGDVVLENEETLKELSYENEKLTWECDEINETANGLEKEVLDIKTVKSNIEFQKFQYEEELSRVKERLEYLEASDNDIIEIKDMLEKVQEDREHILLENEKLQYSIAVQIEENDKLLETMECLHKENTTSLASMKLTDNELTESNKKLTETRRINDELEEKLKNVTSEKESGENRFEGEIEGLLEENSTLKTCVQMRDSEIEAFNIEIERLKCFFPNIDEQADNNSKLLTAKNVELERIVSELGKETENVVFELMETQSKLAEVADENDMLLSKCEDFRRVVSEMDDEKTLLLNTIERTRDTVNEKLQENVLIEKYEIQMECLVQENSTLKTQIMTLHKEIEDFRLTENEIAETKKIELAGNLKRNNAFLQEGNKDYKTKVNDLEQDFLGLVEQVQLYDETAIEKEDATSRLEKEIGKLLRENAQVKEKSASINSDLQEMKENEMYFKEQIKIYERALNSDSENNSQEIERLNAQLELERKYKCKFETDLENANIEILNLENENRDEKEKTGCLHKDLKLAVDRNSEIEQLVNRMNTELACTLADKHALVNEMRELRKTVSELTQNIESLKVEAVTMQRHLQALSENRNYVRNQVEILAAEIEKSQDARDLLQTYINERGAKYNILNAENTRFSEQCVAVIKENEQLQNQLETCKEEIRISNLNDEAIKDIEKQNLNDVKVNLNELQSEIERLKHENENLITDLSEMKEVSDNADDLLVENEMLSNENIDLKQQNETLKNSLHSLREKLARIDQLIERNRTAELDNDALGERLDGLHKRIGDVQKEKQALQTMTDELTNMLHDMQTKYEEVKSEMEITKKTCDKEIIHLQDQLHEMNEDVGELRKMLDYMENEMYSTTEEKDILKENLVQQQSQFEEVVEQKQKLEEILSDKQQKDLKNKHMASQRQKNNSLNTSRSEHGFPNNELHATQDNDIQPEPREIPEYPFSEMLRDSVDSDLSDIVPSFPSAFQLFGLASSDEAGLSDKIVQTNVSIMETESIAFLLDDNGECPMNDKDFSKVDNATQADNKPITIVENLMLEVLPNVDIPWAELEQSLDHSSENEIFGEGASMLAAEYNLGVSDGRHSKPDIYIPLSPTVGAHDEALTIFVEGNMQMESKDNTNIESEVEYHGANQTEPRMESVSCHSDAPVNDNLQASSIAIVDQHENTCLDTDNEDYLFDTLNEDVSVLSADSGILSACTGTDGRIQPFRFPDRNKKTSFESDIMEDEENQDQYECFSSNQEECANNEHDLKEVTFSDMYIQTDLEFEEEIIKAIEKKLDSLEAEFEAKTRELQTEIEKKVLITMEFREKKVELLEENYEKKVKQMEYEYEEAYERKFRMREVEIILEAEREKEAHAADVENAAERKIQKNKIEKDQQFVETLQKVRADLAMRQRKESGDMRQTVSYDTSCGELGLRDVRPPDVGPGGAGDISYGSRHGDTLQRLELENQELASARDVLLQKINITQLEQEVLCQQLQCIMGEQSTMSNAKQPTNKQMPSFLDWELSPDLSFSSVRSSLDAKSLSGSLDPSSFCSNPDCLTVRMRYEHLLDRIQLFLKMRSSHGQLQETGTEEAAAVDGEAVENSNTLVTGGGKYVEHDEDDSQMLNRLTSVHLEHCVRVPQSTDNMNSKDQFVHELDDADADPRNKIELNNDIIKMLVKDSLDSTIDSANYEGHFSENELDDEEHEDDIRQILRTDLDSNDSDNETGVTDSDIAPFSQCRSSVSFVEDDGHFSEEEDSFQLMKKKRHFSDSDINVTERKVVVTTSHSENNEGHFVFERSDSQIETTEKPKSGNRDSNTDAVFDDDQVFEKTQQKRSHARISYPISRREGISPKTLHLEAGGFIRETSSNDDKTPGCEDLVIESRMEPRTGEETGDFFEEKIVKVTVLRPHSMNTFGQMDAILLSKEHKTEVERFDSGDTLEKLVLEVTSDNNQIEPNEMHAPFIEHSRNKYELTPHQHSEKCQDIFVAEGILRESNTQEIDLVEKSSTSGIDLANGAHNLKSDFALVKQEYKTGQQSYENTVFDILNAICPGTDPNRKPSAKVTEDTFHPVLKELENSADDFTESPIESELENLKTECTNLKFKLDYVSRENDDLRAIIKVNDLDNKKDVEVLVEKITELEQINNDVSELDHLNKGLGKGNIDKAEHRRLEQVNVDLSVELNELKEQVFIFQSDLKQNSETVHAHRKMIYERADERTGNMRLESKIEEFEKQKCELEKECCAVSSKNEELLADIQTLNSSVNESEKEKIVLQEEKAKLADENIVLKSISENNSDLLNAQDILKSKVQHLMTEKDGLKTEIEDQRAKSQFEKDELENAMIVQADICDALEKTLQDADKQNVKLKEYLEKNINENNCFKEHLEKENKTLNESIDIEMKENARLTELLEKDISIKIGLKFNEDGLNCKISDLKGEKNELNVVIARLSSENENLKIDVEERNINLKFLGGEIKTFNKTIQEFASEKQDTFARMQHKDETISDLIKLKEDLIQQVHKLETDTKLLEADVKEMTLERSKLINDHESLKCFLDEENESLKLELVKMNEKNELNIVIASLSSENEKLKNDVEESNINLKYVGSEIEMFNKTIQEFASEKQDTCARMQEKDDTISDLIKLKEDLIQQVHKLETDTTFLETDVKEMTVERNKLIKDHESLKCFLDEENRSLKLELVKMNERNDENEWALRELAEQTESLEKERAISKHICYSEKSTATGSFVEVQYNAVNNLKAEIELVDKDVSLLHQPKEYQSCLVECATNTDDSLDSKYVAHEITTLREDMKALKTENNTLKTMLEDIVDVDKFKMEIDSLKLENDTLKRSLECAMVKDDSDTDLQIFEDMKDAIKSMQDEKSSVSQHKKEMSSKHEQENKRLRNEIEDLYTEQDNLKKQIKCQEESARKENGEILKMYSDLRNEVEVLVISKHDLEIELHVLKDLLEQDPYPINTSKEQEPYTKLEKTEHMESRDITLQDVEEMEELKTSIEKLMFDLKEKDSYVRKLEEHLLNIDGTIPEFTTTPKPSMSRGMPLVSKSFLRKRQSWFGYSRKAYSHELRTIQAEIEHNENDNSKPEYERSQTLDTNLYIGNIENNSDSERHLTDELRNEYKVTSSVISDSQNRSSYNIRLDQSERIRSGLKADEDGHLALELKQFELVAEITQLRRDFRDTKAIYSKETALLSEALAKEKVSNDLRRSDFTIEHNVGSNLSHDVLKLRKEVARLKEENRLLNLDCDRWIDRLKEQEQIVSDLKERIGRNTCGYGEIEEVFGRQLALLQKQREELIDKLKDRVRENSSLSENLGEKGILEETLRKEKDMLITKLEEMEKVGDELHHKKLLLEKQELRQKELEDVVYQKDMNEIELMKQKRILEEELREIESRFKDKEEHLDFEKNKLLDELREKRTNVNMSGFSESDEASSVCSEISAFSDRNMCIGRLEVVQSAAFSEKDISRLEVMLEEVEKQHSVAVSVLRDQLCLKYSRREKKLRTEHTASMTRLKQDSEEQVT